MSTDHTDGVHDEADEVIDEIRAVRHQISARFGHDPYKLVAYYIELEKEDAGPFIPAPENPPPGTFNSI